MNRQTPATATGAPVRVNLTMPVTRIGFGPGHYDRLLESVAATARPVRMGVCFADFLDPVEGPIPAEPHDVPMHMVATETGVVTCSTP